MVQKIYAYLRVSTTLQDLKGNKDEIILYIHNLGIDTRDIIFIEEISSGATHWKHRKLGEVINVIKEGDIFITSEISRIGRIFYQISEFFSILHEKKVVVYLTKSSIPLDNSVSSQTMLFALSISAQLERELISQRTKDALQRKKNEGKILGRPPAQFKLNEHKDEIQGLLAIGVKQKALATKYGTTEITMSKFIRYCKLKEKNEQIVQDKIKTK